MCRHYIEVERVCVIIIIEGVCEWAHHAMLYVGVLCVSCVLNTAF